MNQLEVKRTPIEGWIFYSFDPAAPTSSPYGQIRSTDRLIAAFDNYPELSPGDVISISTKGFENKKLKIVKISPVAFSRFLEIGRFNAFVIGIFVKEI
jgi:hypothetical protein